MVVGPFWQSLSGGAEVRRCGQFEKMGVAENLKPKLVFKKLGGAPGNSQAMRETDANFGVGQLSEFAPVTEMDIVGPLPGDLNLVSLFSAAILGGSKEAAAARAFIDFMRTAEAAATLRSLGLEPAFP